MTKSVNALGSAIKEVKTKEFTAEIKEAFKTLTASVDEIKDSTKNLFESLNITDKNGGFAEYAKTLNSQMTEMLSTYKDVITKM